MHVPIQVDPMLRHSGFCSVGPGGVNGENDVGDCDSGVVLLLLKTGKQVGPEHVSRLATPRPVGAS